MGFKIISNDLAENPAIQSVWYDIDTVIVERGTAGVGVLSGCGVTAQGSPDMTLAVAAGTIQAAAGAAPVTVSSGNVTIGAASGSNPRIDLVSASASGVKTVTAGTAAASPKPPDLPSGHIALALILVPTSATTITTARISDRRFTIDGGRVFAQAQITHQTTIPATSTWTDITDATVTLTTAARRVRIAFAIATEEQTGTAHTSKIRIVVDGTAIDTAGEWIQQVNGGPTVYTQVASVVLLSAVLSAASHTIKLQGWNDVGTIKVGNASTTVGYLTVEETEYTV